MSCQQDLPRTGLGQVTSEGTTVPGLIRKCVEQLHEGSEDGVGKATALMRRLVGLPEASTLVCLAAANGVAIHSGGNSRGFASVAAGPLLSDSDTVQEDEELSQFWAASVHGSSGGMPFDPVRDSRHMHSHGSRRPAYEARYKAWRAVAAYLQRSRAQQLAHEGHRDIEGGGGQKTDLSKELRSHVSPENAQWLARAMLREVCLLRVGGLAAAAAAPARSRGATGRAAHPASRAWHGRRASDETAKRLAAAVRACDSACLSQSVGLEAGRLLGRLTRAPSAAGALAATAESHPGGTVGSPRALSFAETTQSADSGSVGSGVSEKPMPADGLGLGLRLPPWRSLAVRVQLCRAACDFCTGACGTGYWLREVLRGTYGSTARPLLADGYLAADELGLLVVAGCLEGGGGVDGSLGPASPSKNLAAAASRLLRLRAEMRPTEGALAGGEVQREPVAGGHLMRVCDPGQDAAAAELEAAIAKAGRGGAWDGGQEAAAGAGGAEEGRRARASPSASAAPRLPSPTPGQNAGRGQMPSREGGYAQLPSRSQLPGSPPKRKIAPTLVSPGRNSSGADAEPSTLHPSPSAGASAFSDRPAAASGLAALEGAAFRQELRQALWLRQPRVAALSEAARGLVAAEDLLRNRPLARLCEAVAAEAQASFASGLQERWAEGPAPASGLGSGGDPGRGGASARILLEEAWGRACASAVKEARLRAPLECAGPGGSSGAAGGSRGPQGPTQVVAGVALAVAARAGADRAVGGGWAARELGLVASAARVSAWGVIRGARLAASAAATRVVSALLQRRRRGAFRQAMEEARGGHHDGGTGGGI